MNLDQAQRIAASPEYQQLVAKRSSFGWIMTVIMLVVYYGYILLVAFNKQFLATPLGNGVTTIGMPIGLFVIVFTIAITALYVRRANGEFDRLTAAIVSKESK